MAFLRVRIGELQRFVPIAELREVLPMLALSHPPQSLPNTPHAPGFSGILNLRGELIPIFDAARALRDPDPDRFILVLASRPKPLGLIVDDVLEVTTDEAEVHSQDLGAGRPIHLVTTPHHSLPLLDWQEALA